MKFLKEHMKFGGNSGERARGGSVGERIGTRLHQNTLYGLCWLAFGQLEKAIVI